MTTIGIDLGGTNIRVGVQDHGAIVQKRNVSLFDKDSVESTLTQLIDNVRPLMQPEVTRIGIAVPSVVDIENGIVYNVVNIPSWKKVELKSIMEREFKIPVQVDNDANAFVLGEQQHGTAKRYKSVVGLVMGTGLGSGLMLDGKLYRGNNCGSGEVGYFPYMDKDFEYYCSGNFFSAIHNISALEASQRAIAGDQSAIKMWNEYGKHVGNAVKAIVYAYDPEVIVLGGSIAKAYPLFYKAMRQAMTENFHFPESMRRLTIERSEDENITLLGAASLINI